MDIETKLDEDFFFYLGFVRSYLKHIRDKETKHRCELWLQKLCGEPCEGIEQKRGRNIYLSQLLLCMQSGNLAKEFLQPINEVDLTKASEAFELTAPGEEFEPPAWLQDSDVTPQTSGKEGQIGRTYLATRALPDGQGAFAYVAVCLGDEEPKWLGGGEGVFDQHMEQKFREEVPEYEIEKILLRRKDPKEREKVITYYTVLLKNIEDELDEKIQPHQNETINGLLEQLEQDMRDREQFGPYEALPPEQLRIELLLILHDRITLRIKKVQKREALLDEIENKIVSKSFFETSVTAEDKLELPATMWQQVINKPPNKSNIDKLKANYPLILIEKFLELLSNHKEEIAMRMQRRHENIAAQMKRELRREDEKGRKALEEAQIAYDKAFEIVEDVREHFKRKQTAEQVNTDKTKIEQSEHSQLYDQMRAALYETQKSVENEAERGRELAAQITLVSEQAEACTKCNEENVKKIEMSNMAVMKNIQRLNAAIDNMQKRIERVQMAKTSKKGNTQFDVMF